MTWETMAIALYLVDEYDKSQMISRLGLVLTLPNGCVTDAISHSNDKQEQADIIAGYSLHSTALA
jgi:hypothetical protein